MAKILEELPLPLCPVGCPNKDMSIHTDIVYADGQIYEKTVSIQCSHEAVCAMWVAKEIANKKMGVYL